MTTRLTISLIVLSAFGLLFSVIRGQDSSDVKTSQAAPSTAVSRPRTSLSIKEFSSSTVEANRIVNRLGADHLEVRPRRFMAFNIKSVNEALINNARLKMYEWGRAGGRQSFDIQKAISLPGKGGGYDVGQNPSLGLVTRLIIRKIIVEYYRDGTHFIDLTAQSGLIEKDKGDVKFRNALLEDVRSGRVIKSRKIRWDKKRRVFIVPGTYVMNSRDGITSGNAIEIDLEFNVTSPGSRGKG